MLQIRHGVFETNSSSTHSITICMKSDYEKWKNGEVFLKEKENGKFITKDEALDSLRNRSWNPIANPEMLSDETLLEELGYEEIYTYESYDSDYLEGFCNSFETPNGETVIAFGEYGHD